MQEEANWVQQHNSNTKNRKDSCGGYEAEKHGIGQVLFSGIQLMRLNIHTEILIVYIKNVVLFCIQDEMQLHTQAHHKELTVCLFLNFECSYGILSSAR